MNWAPVDCLLENKYGGALWILGIFLNHVGRANAREKIIHRESIVGESVVPVLGYPNIPGGDQCNELLPEAGHQAFSGFSPLR